MTVTNAISAEWLEKQGVRYVFHQDIFRAKDEKLCLKATVELVCLIKENWATARTTTRHSRNTSLLRVNRLTVNS